MTEQHEFIIGGGKLEFVYADALEPLLHLGQAETVRVSHVEPCEGGWSARMEPSGVVLGPFRLRREALAAEREWIREHMGV